MKQCLKSLSRIRIMLKFGLNFKKDSCVKENPELGRLFRKPTQPQVPVAPRKPRIDNNKTEFGVKPKSEAARVLF